MAKIIGLFTFCLLLPVFAATAPAQIAYSFADARDTASTRGFAGQCDKCDRMKSSILILKMNPKTNPNESGLRPSVMTLLNRQRLLGVV